MSFRIEEKILIGRNDLLKIQEFILKNNGGVLHPNRKICSVYFDNKNLQSFRDSDDCCAYTGTKNPVTSHKNVAANLYLTIIK